MFSDAGNFTARRRHRVLSLFVSFILSFCFVSVSFHGLLEIVGLWASSAVEGCVRRLRCRIKALCFLILTCNSFLPSTAMLGPDLVLTFCVCGFPRSTLRPDLTARRSCYGNLCSWDSMIYPVAGSVNSTSDYDVQRFSFDFTLALCRQYGNIGSGRLWRIAAFTLQSNLVKLLPLFAGAVVKTYQTPPWGQERPLPRSSFVEEKIGQLFVSSMRGSLCPDPIPVNLTTILTVLVRTMVLKCLSKSQIKVTIFKLEVSEVRWESSVILLASDYFENLSNALSSLSKLVFLSFYCFSCFVVVATRLAYRVCPIMYSSHHVTD
ncbi:hypothetical protein N665_0122s0041 [Sinapis alba]|nr:hypothetical protein N665_0122s0041 [Sinapis alba]